MIDSNLNGNFLITHEVGSDGITVNLITPGLTLTQPVVENFDPELAAEQRTGRALARDQHPEDRVGPVHFLASPEFRLHHRTDPQR